MTAISITGNFKAFRTLIPQRSMILYTLSGPDILAVFVVELGISWTFSNTVTEVDFLDQVPAAVKVQSWQITP
jgi:hypothetical protein